MAFSNEKKKKKRKRNEYHNCFYQIAIMSAMMSVKEQCTTCDRDASECLKVIKVDDPVCPIKPWKSECKFSDEYGEAHWCPWCEKKNKFCIKELSRSVIPSSSSDKRKR